MKVRQKVKPRQGSIGLAKDRMPSFWELATLLEDSQGRYCPIAVGAAKGKGCSSWANPGSG